MEKFLEIMDFFTELIWSLPMLVLLLGTHIYFTFRLGFIQKLLFKGIRLSFSRTASDNNSTSSSAKESTYNSTQKSGISPYASLATSLAATMGTGNIIGISTAIAIGGPGAVFWCWITGILGMATCYGECLLSLLYRLRNSKGEYVGGPMYVLEHVLHKKGLAMLFSFAAILASFGVGSSVQSHSISAAVTTHFSMSPHMIGILTALLSGFVILGGVKQIAKICTFFVPFMSLFYLSGCLWLLFLNRDFLMGALLLITQSAFSSRSLMGGLAGAAVMAGIRVGISRGLFTNEAGLGSLPMTAAVTDTSSPVKQSLISMTGPFWDTVVICAITGLVIISSILKNPAAYAGIPIDMLCTAAFSQLPFAGSEILSISLVLFAFATILGWCFYGECGITYLVGEKGITTYRLFYIFFIYLGAVISLDIVWGVSDLLNAFMALPNLFCLWKLREVVIQKTLQG